METQQAKASKFVLNYGLILGIIMVVLGVIMYVANYHLDPHWSFSVISFAIFIAVVFYGVKAFKNENGGFLTIGEAIKVGVGIALIAGIISAIWAFILSTYVEPDYMAQMAEMQREKMVERFPEMTDQQLDKAAEMNSTFMKPWFTSAVTIVSNLLFGLLTGLVAGLIMKQKRPYDV
ncbi:Protein of unknown function [Salinimicrobium catena]|uniref:DUF4199 domain-containing protein n=1 Tax=Salinimicrobium catena TaxID=390640 RepID=A0A1H5P3K9_9FLAO|nr:DUF4199 domain-containing protein [Salinimicrobium catena]SDL67958.1 Protein of unknown function [Salinimicrobium catena]SEF08194.1 Protein of unknown function [Salinimicrobium catena]